MIHDAVLAMPCFSIDRYYMPYCGCGEIGFVWRGRKFYCNEDELRSSIQFLLLKMVHKSRLSGISVIAQYYCESPIEWHLVCGSSKPLWVWAEKDGDTGIAIYCLARDRRLGTYPDEHFRKWGLCNGVLAGLALRYCCIQSHFLGDDQDWRR
jgi:hypothetical protein